MNNATRVNCLNNVLTSCSSEYANKQIRFLDVEVMLLSGPFIKSIRERLVACLIVKSGKRCNLIVNPRTRFWLSLDSSSPVRQRLRHRDLPF